MCKHLAGPSPGMLRTSYMRKPCSDNDGCDEFSHINDGQMRVHSHCLSSKYADFVLHMLHSQTGVPVLIHGIC